MKDPKNNRDKLSNLIEAFSELTENDMEEARAIILSAGKNPDDILKKGRELITAIRRQRDNAISVSKDYEKDFIKVFTISQGRLELSDPPAIEGDILDVHRAYSFLMQKPSDLKISKEAAEVKLMRYVKTIYFQISIGPEYATAFLLLNSEPVISIPINSISTFIKTGYCIDRRTCYPLEPESLDFAAVFIKDLEQGNRISLKLALSYFAKRQNYPFLRFEHQEFDLNMIFRDERYNGASKLFTKDLYDYQQDGLKWLMYCCINRLGGILADDMGLGKTAQVIALVACIIERDILGQILIVVPSTLLENWRREFQFFASEVTPYIHHGLERTGSPASLSKHRVIITSYSMIINDLYLFNKLKWGLVILDEASLIKNPESERKVALGELDSEVNIAMTGTPIENSLQDLWSIADFARKGYLGTRTEFNARYKPKPVANVNIENTLASLRDVTSYIMLRRRKEAVLDSLPARIDIHQALEMGDAEAVSYELERKTIVSSSSVNSGDFLRLIMEMRMFTTHPLLRDKEEIRNANMQRLAAVSTKFSRTMEILSEIRIKNEKALIFTEFIEMIDVFQRVLSAHYKIPVWTIDGRVKTEERQLNIDRFKDQLGFAIMVLNPRTAGMGLNITAANHVIHYTRQWNPALEEQASARAYRNGQDKGVNIYYLYYSSTIEEIIDARLRHKKSVSEEVIIDTEAENMQEYLDALKLSPIK